MIDPERLKQKKRGKRRILIASGLLILGGLLAKFSFLGNSDADALVILIPQKIIGIALIIWAVKLLKVGRRMTAPNPEELLAIDCRRPVLYMRSFDHDQRTLDKQSLLAKLYNPTGIRTLVRYEEQVSEWMSRIGPVIAIGRPGEALPELGAARVYVDDEGWQQKLLEMHRASALVVMQAGASEGLKWEIGKVFEPANFKPTLICFAPETRRSGPPERIYASFKEALRIHHDVELPATLNSSYVLWFDTAKRGVAVPASDRRFGIASKTAPGFEGAWPLLDPCFPGVSVKSEAMATRVRTMKWLAFASVATILGVIWLWVVQTV